MKKEDLKFIDNHTHGAYGVNFNNCNYDEVKYVLKKLYKRNIKGICPTLVGDENKKIIKQLEIFSKIKREQLKKIDNETFIIGVHLEGSFLSSLKSGIQDKKNFLKLTKDNFKLLTAGYEDIIKIVTLANEEDIDLIKYLNKKNIIVQLGHTNSDNIKNIKGLTHIFNAMPQIHHRNPTCTLKGLIDDNIYCEVIADLIHLSQDIINLILKTKPKDRIILISDSLPNAHHKKDIIFCNKKINRFGKDEKGTLAGSVKTIDEIAINLIKKNILTKEDINQMGFKNQIKYLNLENREIDILNK